MNEDQNRQAWFALLALFGINLMNFFDRQIPAVLNEMIRKPHGLTPGGLSDTAMGWINTAFTLMYAAAGVPLGRLADRWKRTRILSLGVTLWSMLTAASGLAWSYWSLFAARLGVGIGEASCAPAGNSLIGDLFPAHKRARAISVFMLGLPLGIFLANLTVGQIAAAYQSWRVPFFIACLPGFVLAGLIMLIHEPKRGASEEIQMAEKPTDGSPYRRVLGISTMWWIILSGALHNFNAYAVNAFMPAFLMRFHGMDIKQAGRVSAVVLGAVGVVGLLAGGMLADWISKRRANGRLLLSALSLAVSTPCVYLALNQPKGSLTAFMLLMGVGWMLIYVYYVTVYPAIQDVVEPNLRATAMALYFFAMYVLGGSFGTSILGMLSDYYARRAMVAAGATAMAESFKAAGLHSAFYVVPLVSLVLSLVLFAGARGIAKDMERLQKRMLDAANK